MCMIRHLKLRVSFTIFFFFVRWRFYARKRKIFCSMQLHSKLNTFAYLSWSCPEYKYIYFFFVLKEFFAIRSAYIIIWKRCPYRNKWKFPTNFMLGDNKFSHLSIKEEETSFQQCDYHFLDPVLSFGDFWTNGKKNRFFFFFEQFLEIISINSLHATEIGFNVNLQHLPCMIKFY